MICYKATHVFLGILACPFKSIKSRICCNLDSELAKVDFSLGNCIKNTEATA
jgi:hypothetical protein